MEFSTNIAVPYNSPAENIITVEHLLPDEGINLDPDLNLAAEFADFISSGESDLQILDPSPTQNVSDVIHQLHGGHEEPFSLGNSRNDNSPPHQNGYNSDGSYQPYQQKNPQLIENCSNGDYQLQKQKYALSPQDQSYPQYNKHRRCLPDSPPDSGSEPCSSPPENRDFIDSNRYLNNANLTHRLPHQQHNHIHTLPGGSSPSAVSTCSQHSGGSSSGSSYVHNGNHNQQQLSPHDTQVQIQQQEFENTLDSVRTSVANSRNLHQQQSMDHSIGNGQSFHTNVNFDQPGQSGTNFYSGPGISNHGQANDVHSPGSNGLPHSGQQHTNPLIEHFLTSQMSAPSAKKRRLSDSPPGLQIPEQLSATQLNQQYQQMIAMQQSIKREPGLASPTACGTRGFYNDTFEIGESSMPRHHTTIQRSAMMGGGTVQMAVPGVGNTVLQQSNGIQRQNSTVSSVGPSSHYMENSSYQVIKWSPHQRETWCQLLDADCKELRTVSYRVDADKGFNFAVPDDTFVCQKKNHFQVTVHIGVDGHPAYVKTEEGVKQIESFFLNLYGIKYESMSQTINIEQSQSDRSKKSFHPVKVDLPGNQVTKVTVGRLHFSETTSNNMRKKGRPNPDQRYFMCVVALQASAQGRHYMVSAAQTERIIVRASNPGQFDSDAVPWQSGTGQDTIFHHGKVGINCDKPDESLVVHGNLKVTGRVMQPSDMRAKENIEEVDTTDQLKNVQNLRIVRYNYTPEYCEVAGIDPKTVTTGVLAQDIQKIMPQAVKETGDVQLNGGRTIPNFLVVDKEQLFMENVGAVKALCNLTTNIQSRIDHLEKWNKKLSKVKKYGSIRSNVSMISGISDFSLSTGSPSVSRMGSARFSKDRNQNPGTKGKTKRNSSRDSEGRNSDRRDNQQDSTGFACLNQKLTSGLVIALFLVMLFSFGAISTLYAISLNNNGGCTGSNCALMKDNATSSDSTDVLRSTTEPSTRTEPHSSSHAYVDPISYCPAGGRFNCDEQKQYCCDVANPGSSITVTCLKTIVLPGVFPEQPRSFPFDHKHKKGPVHPYEPPMYHHPVEPQHRFPNHKDKSDKQIRPHHRGQRKHAAVVPHPTMMDYHDAKDTVNPTAQTGVMTTTSKQVIHTSPKFLPKLNATEKKDLLKNTEKENLEPMNFNTENNRKHPSDQSHGHNRDDTFDDVQHDQIDTKQPQERSALPSSEVRKRVRRVANSDEDDQPESDNVLANAGLKMLSIRLVQPDVTLYQNGTETKYLVCKIPPGNFSFNVPVSMHTPPGVPITIEFNTTVPAYISLCNHKRKSNCPELGGEYQPGEDSNGRVRTGTTHRFVLLFSSYISSDYWFRMTTEDRTTDCQTSMEEIGKTFEQFRFRFYRPCTVETPSTEEDDAPNPALYYKDLWNNETDGSDESASYDSENDETDLPYSDNVDAGNADLDI